MVIDVDAGGDCGASGTISSLSSMPRSRQLLGRLSGALSVEVTIGDNHNMTDIPCKPLPQPELHTTPPCSRLKSSSFSTLPSSSSSSTLMSSASFHHAPTNRSPPSKNSSLNKLHKKRKDIPTSL